MMKIYYSTYGMQELNIFEALPRLCDIGYQGIEIAVTPGWPTNPTIFSKADRKQLKSLLNQLEFSTPPLMALLSPCLPKSSRQKELVQFKATFEMAEELRVDECPSVVTTTLGHPKPDWDSGKSEIVDYLLEVAEMGQKHDVILAIEPHAGGDFETPEKAAWLMENTSHDHLKLNFDYSHFYVEHIDLQHAVDLNIPYAVHNHIKDGYRDEQEKVNYLLPGEGKLDLSNYVKVLSSAGWNSYLCPEVTAQIWKRPDYDPWITSERCFHNLDLARSNL
ncbi:MAG: sugar phosphate isomerase/epimerase [Candidatus Latescibacterota bacterium]|nr:sugar phosphate isomerase/epimerase [Candidatus Latescibacterota bacterium]